MDYIPINPKSHDFFQPRSLEVSLGSPCRCGAAAQLAAGLERGEPGADGEIHVFFFF